MSLNYIDTLVFDITKGCNLNCLHCYNSDDIDELVDENKFDILSQLKEGSHVHFLGGEPLFDKKFPYYLDFLISRNISYSLVTNGTLLESSFFKYINHSMCKSFTISLDGTNSKEHDYIRNSFVFDDVIQKIIDMDDFSKMKLNINSL